MSLWISERNILPPAWIISAGMWSIPVDLYLFSFSIVISILKRLGSDIIGSAVCISVCLISLMSGTFNSWQVILQSIQNIFEICKQINVLVLFEGGFGLALLKLRCASICVSDTFILAVCFNIINFVFQIFRLCCSWKLYYFHVLLFHIICIYLASILHPLQFNLLHLIT